MRMGRCRTPAPFPVGGVFRDKLRRFVLLVKSGIEIRRFRTELGRAGVHHLIGRAQLFKGQRIQSRQTQHGLVQEALHFCGAVQLFRQYAASQPGQRKLCFGQPLQLCQKPRVNFSDIVNRLKRHAALDGLVHNKRAVGIAHMQFSTTSSSVSADSVSSVAFPAPARCSAPLS